MKTRIKKDGNTVTVAMDGKLDFETYIPLREELNKLAQQTKTDSVAKNIVFDLEKLEFVGSSGISSFVQVLKEFNASRDQSARPHYTNVKSEFKRVIKAFDEDSSFEFIENETPPKNKKQPLDH